MKIVVHEFLMGDVDDPMIYAAEPLYKWEQSEQGQWVMQNAIETPTYYVGGDPYHWGHVVRITANLDEKNVTYFKLKWGMV